MIRGPAGVVAALLAVTGCSASDDTFTVLAASSLTDIAPALVEDFVGTGDAPDIVYSYAGSNVLATQAIEGRPFDLLLTADDVSMTRAADAATLAGDPVTFARNRLAIVVPPDNPGEVAGLDDLADPDLLVAICAPMVPCGALTVAAMESTGVEIRADTLDPSVRTVLTRVQAGGIDAGIVYRTDALAAGATVKTFDLPPTATQSTPYLAAASADGSETAREFVDYLTSDDAATILSAAGFEQP